MRKLVFLTTAVISFFFARSQNLKTPSPSPPQTIKQDFGISSIELSYSRPGVKGRKVFGDLVPYGKVWRTGANNATTITFEDDVTIEDKKIPAGIYGLLTIPGKDEWIVIITKQTDVTNPAAYKQDQDVARFSVKPFQLPFSIETFTMDFNDLTNNSCKWELMWDSVYVHLAITTDVDTKVMSQIKDVMKADNRPYFQAAVYYMNSGKDLKQALAWFDKAIEQQPDAYFIHYQRATCLAKLGRKDDAIAASKKSMELAKEANNDDYVRLNEKLLDQLK